MKEFFLNILINYFCLFERLTAWIEIAGEDFGDSAKAPGTFFGLPLFFSADPRRLHYYLHYYFHYFYIP
jgi:hypothetical protein